MISEGYLTSVTEPKLWCSPLTAVKRPDKPSHPVRICIDPVKTIYLAIKYPAYPMQML